MIQLARWAGVPVWELLKQPLSLIRKLNEAMTVEKEVKEALMERAKHE